MKKLVLRLGGRRRTCTNGDSRMGTVEAMEEVMVEVEAGLSLWTGTWYRFLCVRCMSYKPHSRREQRDRSTVSIWPSSPKAPTRSYVCCSFISCFKCLMPLSYRSSSPDPKRSKKSRKHKRDASSSSASSTDSEEERRRRERKERKRARKEERKEKKRGGKDKERRRSRSVDKDSEDERDRRDRPKRSESRRSRSADKHRRSATRTKSPEARPPSSEVEMEDEWVEAPATSSLVAAASGAGTMLPPPIPASKSSVAMDEDDSDDDEIGPQPLTKPSSSKKFDERQYGGALLRGEGSAMAAFLQDGTDSRIPRRGEIGLSSDEIATFETVGYVMSGSRHRRMNAVRMRKENQVISAEEKRGILKLQQEERERREAILREEFQALVDDKLKDQGK